MRGGLAFADSAKSGRERHHVQCQGTFSGSSVQVPVDLDATHCTSINGITTCPSDSALFTFGSTISGGPEPGQFTGQVVSESVPVSGTGCSLAAGTIEGCSIGSVTNGCLYKYIGGNSFNRQVTTGDVLVATLTSGTMCVNFTTELPWNFNTSGQFAFTHGTGKFAGVTGSYTVSASGQIVQNDKQGHGMAWDTGSGNGTITVP